MTHCLQPQTTERLAPAAPTCITPAAPPARAALQGLEGFWGLVLCSLALPAVQHIRGPGGLPLDSIAQAIQASSPGPEGAAGSCVGALAGREHPLVPA